MYQTVSARPARAAPRVPGAGQPWSEPRPPLLRARPEPRGERTRLCAANPPRETPPAPSQAPPAPGICPADGPADRRLEAPRRRSPGGSDHPDHGFSELEQRALLGVSEVRGQRFRAHGERVDPADQIVHETEAAGLLAVTEHRHRLALDRLAQEGRDGPSVMRAHPGAVGVEIRAMQVSTPCWRCTPW